jgi:hypothetical protein
MSGGRNDLPAFAKGLSDAGYEHGRNVIIEVHSRQYDQLR